MNNRQKIIMVWGPIKRIVAGNYSFNIPFLIKLNQAYD